MWPALIGAAATLAGNWFQNRQANAQAERQMQFQERMSNTAIQRGKADAEAAGFNPAAYGVGGASVPGGASAPVGNLMEGGVSNAMAASLMRAQVREAEAKADTAKEESVSAAARASIDRAEAGVLVSGDTNGSAYEAFKRAKLSEWRRAAAENAAGEAAAPLQLIGVSNAVTRDAQLLPIALSSARQANELQGLALPEARAMSSVFSGPIGKWLPLVDKLVGTARGVAGLAGTVTGGAGAFKTGMQVGAKIGRMKTSKR